MKKEDLAYTMAASAEDDAVIPFNEGWRFHRGDAPGAESLDYDDHLWQTVRIPHDFCIEDLPPIQKDPLAPPSPVDSPHVRSGPFDSAAPGGAAQGYTLGGIAWYRKQFRLPGPGAGRRVYVLFDGAYMDAHVWVNGQFVGRHPYGYTPFFFDVTEYLAWNGAPNVLAVRLDSSGKTSRWYSGSGLYRAVNLLVVEPVHIPPWGVRVDASNLARDAAEVQIGVEVWNFDEVARNVAVSCVIRPPDAAVPGGAARSGEQVLQPGDRFEFRESAHMTPVQPWSPDSPALYTLVVDLHVDGRSVRCRELQFGVRSISFDPERGFVLNGTPMLLRGGCVHHDNGCLGACAWPDAEERRVSLLKASGFNAVRTAHNPPSTAFLDACDRLGMLVIDEAFDCWRKGKNPQDYGRFFDDWRRTDLKAMILRDRNHPSVIMWSIGNEAPDQADEVGVEIARDLARFVRRLDPTRPVTVAAHPFQPDVWEKLDPFFAEVDVAGYNYRDDKYESDHERVPSRVIIGTESFPGHCFEQWQATRRCPWVAGDFVWTALDYLGEAGIGHAVIERDGDCLGPEPRTWPWTIANCGDLDLCGFKRPQSYFRDVVWHRGDPVSCFVHAPIPEGCSEKVSNWGWPDERPSWTWPGHEGEPLTVNVYSYHPRVRLLLNGREIGAAPTSPETRYTATWQVPYEPGVLEAVALDASGNVLGRTELRTCRGASAIRLSADRTVLSADNTSLAFVVVEVTDDDGILDPNADHLIEFEVDGPIRLLAVGSANPRSFESFRGPRRRAFRGRCMAVVQAAQNAGNATIKAGGAEVAPGQLQITVV